MSDDSTPQGPRRLSDAAEAISESAKPTLQAFGNLAEELNDAAARAIRTELEDDDE